MSAATQVSFEFVVGNEPDQLKCSNLPRLRAQASRTGWETCARRKPGRWPRRRPPKSNPIDLVVPESPDNLSKNADSDPQEESRPSPAIEYQLGGGRVDPFGAYPGDRKPFIPALIDHYLVHMAVDIPELDQPGNKGLLRSRWFPLVLSDVAVFQTILLLSASNASSVHRKIDKECRTLTLKFNAIQSINQTILAKRTHVSDAIIGAVAKMASYEAMYGNVMSYRMHMEGLKRMVEIRGGLESLGLGGLLRRIVVWIDLNSSFLLNIPRVFPGYQFVGEPEMSQPNPERFVAP